MYLCMLAVTLYYDILLIAFNHKYFKEHVASQLLAPRLCHGGSVIKRISEMMKTGVFTEGQSLRLTDRQPLNFTRFHHMIPSVPQVL